MPQNVLLVIHSLRVSSGAAKVLSEIGSNLSKRGHDIIFLSFYEGDQIYDCEAELISFEEERDHHDSYPFHYMLRNFKRGKKIANICCKKSIDTVISFNYEPNISTILSQSIFNNNSRIIISVRSNPLETAKGKKSFFLKKHLFPKADKIISLSKGVENLLNSKFSVENTKTIYNPYSIEKFRELGKDSIEQDHKKLFDEDFTFINIGRLEKQKGQWHLLRAFKKIQEKNEQSKLIILGDGSLRKELEKLIERLGLEDKIFLPGVVENVFPYLRESDCFVFPSLFEGFGNAQIEALSQNLPVISADCIAGPRDILCPELDMDEDVDYPYYGEYGILSKPFDQKMSFETLEEKSLTEEEETLAQAMIKIKEDEKLREKYSNGVERVKDFDPEKIIDQWEEIL